MSDGTISFNYSQADAAFGNMGSLSSAMEQNTTNLRSLYNKLMAEMDGATKEQMQAVMGQFDQKITDYDGKVKQLNNTMSTKAGGDGEMRQTDIAQGNRFSSIKA